MHRDEAWRTAKERLLSEKPMRSHIEPVQDMLCAFIKLDLFSVPKFCRKRDGGQLRM